MRGTPSTKVLAAATAALLVAVACGGTGEPAPSDRAGGGKKRQERAGPGRAKGASKDRKGTPDAAVAAPGGTPGAAPAEAAVEGSGSGGFDRAATDSRIDPSLARASASVVEAEPDARKEGLTPGYAEVTEASIQGLGATVRFTLTFAGDVPERMDDDKTYMVVGFATTGRKKNDAIAMGANGTDEGWRPYAGAKGETQKFPGTFSIEGNRIVMEVPWSFVDGPRTFSWYANSSWFTQVANTTHYSFDPVPNEEAGRFPN